MTSFRSLLISPVIGHKSHRIEHSAASLPMSNERIERRKTRPGGTLSSSQSSGSMSSWQPTTLKRRLPALLKEIRKENHVSMRVLADEAGVNVSVVSRAERGGETMVSTWDKLFDALGHYLQVEVYETSEEWPDIMSIRSAEREARKRDALFLYAGGKRW